MGGGWLAGAPRTTRPGEDTTHKKLPLPAAIFFVTLLSLVEPFSPRARRRHLPTTVDGHGCLVVFALYSS